MIMKPSFFRKMDCVIAHKERKVMCSKSMKKSFGKSGFTLIELLVVISIIAVLLSILMPALSKAKYIAKRLICLTHVKDQATSLFTYAAATDGKFPDNNGNGPTYHRTSALLGSNVFELMYGSYIPDADIMFCPILESENPPGEKRYYFDAGSSTYGTWSIMEWSGISDQGVFWDPSTMALPTYIVSSYCWYVNFRQDPGISPANRVKYAAGAPHWPEDMEACSSRSIIITHEVNMDGPDLTSSLIRADGSHGGEGWVLPLGLTIADMETIDNPIGHGDGSVTFHKKNKMKIRANAPEFGVDSWYAY